MSTFALELDKIKTGTAPVMLEPALNAFGSMLLIAKSDDEPGIHEWVSKTRAQMLPEERFRHTLVMIGFHHTVQTVPLCILSGTAPRCRRRWLLS